MIKKVPDDGGLVTTIAINTNVDELRTKYKMLEVY